MKAIQIKYLAPTNTKPARLKCWAEGVGSMTADCDSEGTYGIEVEATELVQAFLKKNDWDTSCKISGFGTLPNGDFVATLG